MNAASKRWLILLALCIILLPAIIYAFGSAIVGPYEGESGLLGLMGHIYGDAVTGNLAAWLVLLAPALLVLIWQAVFWLQRIISQQMAN